MPNLTQKDLWLNIPVAADDNYITQLAILIRDSLSPNLKVHLEYANETWNPYYFVNRTYVDSLGDFRGYDVNPFIAGQKFHTVRSIEMFQIFDAVFGSQVNRLNHVIASQATWDFTGRVIVETLKNPILNPSNYFHLIFMVLSS